MIFVDIIIAILLVITIAFCLKLNRKIIELQKSKKDLAVLFKYFDNATKRAEEGIESLKYTTHKATASIDNKINEAKMILDDLLQMREQFERIIEDVKQASSETRQANINNNIGRTVHSNFFQNPSRISTHPATINNPVINNPIIRTPSNDEFATSNSSMSDSKKNAITELLNKISEIQKKTNN
ncbi:MAG: hypothetical protein J0H68_07650 [Sphingobacteriia bacterium]|nr:hypothetical protein [Sphingobacteriia bacterium]